jgi:hypothetical protein
MRKDYKFRSKDLLVQYVFWPFYLCFLCRIGTYVTFIDIIRDVAQEIAVFFTFCVF